MARRFSFCLVPLAFFCLVFAFLNRGDPAQGFDAWLVGSGFPWIIILGLVACVSLLLLLVHRITHIAIAAAVSFLTLVPLALHPESSVHISGAHSTAAVTQITEDISAVRSTGHVAGDVAAQKSTEHLHDHSAAHFATPVVTSGGHDSPGVHDHSEQSTHLRETHSSSAQGHGTHDAAGADLIYTISISILAGVIFSMLYIAFLNRVTLRRLRRNTSQLTAPNLQALTQPTTTPLVTGLTYHPDSTGVTAVTESAANTYSYGTHRTPSAVSSFASGQPTSDAAITTQSMHAPNTLPTALLDVDPQRVIDILRRLSCLAVALLFFAVLAHASQILLVGTSTGVQPLVKTILFAMLAAMILFIHLRIIPRKASRLLVGVLSCATFAIALIFGVNAVETTTTSTTANVSTQTPLQHTSHNDTQKPVNAPRGLSGLSTPAPHPNTSTQTPPPTPSSHPKHHTTPPTAPLNSTESTSLPTPTPAEVLTGHPLPPESTLTNYFSIWMIDTLWLSICIALVFFYLAGVAKLRKKARWPWARTVSWLFGVLLMFYITNGGVAVYGMYLFSAHMVMHMTLGSIIPIFLAAACPVTLLLRAIPPRKDGTLGLREWVLLLLNTRFVQIISTPLVTSAIFILSMFIFYFTDLLQLGITSYLGHQLMMFHFFLSGYLFVQSILATDPTRHRFSFPSRMLVLVLAMATHAFFGIAIMSSRYLFLPEWFGAMGRTWGSTPLVDQQIGGALAWGTTEIPTILLVVFLFFRWFRYDQREARRKDRFEDRNNDKALRAYNDYLAGLQNQNI